MISTRHVATLLAASLAACVGGGGTSDGTGTGGDPSVDLAVSVSAPAGAAAGDTVAVTYTIRNVGTSTTFWAVELRFGAATTPWDALQRFGYAYAPGYLAPGQTVTDTVHLTLAAGLAGGDYQVAALVDGGNDGHPANDRAAAQLHVSGAPCTDDASEQDDIASQAKPFEIGALVARNFCFDPADWASFQARAGDRLGVRLESAGEPVAVSIVPAGHLPGDQLVTSSPGVPVSGRFTVPADGTYEIFTHPAANGTGVGRGYSLALLPDRPDPEAVMVWDSHLAPLTVGGVAPVGVEVMNHGYGMAGPVTVEFVLSADGVLDPQDRRIDRQLFPALGENELGSADYLLPIPADVAAGDWNLFAVIDPDGVLPEIIEENDVTPPWPLQLVTPACTPDAFEDDDDPAAAQPIALGAAQARNHCDDAHDWASFDAVAGEAFTVEAASSPLRDISLRVLAPSGALVAEQADYGGVVVTFTAAETGTYRVEAGTGAGGTYGTTGTVDASSDYALTLTRAQPDLTVQASVSEPFASGGVVEVYLDYYDLAATPAGPFDVGLYLSRDGVPDAGDALLADLAIPGATRGPYERLFVPVEIPASVGAGTWYLLAVADPAGAVPELDETNNVSALQVQVAAPVCAPDAYEPDDLPAHAGALALDVPQLRNQCDDARDWVAIQVVQGDPLAVRLDQVSGAGSDLRLYAQDGATLLASTFGAIFWRADRTGTVLLCAGCSDAPAWSGPASYRLTAGLCPPDANEPDDGAATARSIQVPATVTLNQCDGTEDWLVFQAVAGSRYGLSVSAASSGTGLTAAFCDANGYPVPLGSGGDLVPSASGPVYVRIQPPVMKTLLDSAYTVSVSVR